MLSLKGTGTSVCDVIRTQPMSLGHRPSIGFRCEAILEGNKGNGELRLSLKGTGTSICDVKRTHSMLLGHRPSIGFRCEEILEGNAGRGELRHLSIYLSLSDF